MATLRELRERAFLSQRELAEKADISQATVNRIEAGKHKPLMRTIRALAEALGVKPSEIDFS